MKINIISSSTRSGRLSHRIALALRRALESLGASVQITDLKELDLPPFQERLSHIQNPPQKWINLKQELMASDGLVFLTPEYNGAPTSGLKNFIDLYAKSAFEGKPIGTATGSTGGMGGIRAAYIVQQMILSINAFPHPRMLTVGKMDQVLSESGEYLDERTQSNIEDYASIYTDWVRKMTA